MRSSAKAAATNAAPAKAVREPVAAAKEKPAPVVQATPVTKAKPAQSTPAQSTPAQTATAKPVAAPVAPAAKVTPVAEAPKAEWPVEKPAAKPVEVQQAAKPTTESKIETPNPQVPGTADFVPVAAAPETKGDMIMTDVLKTAKTYADEAKTHIQGAMSEMSSKAKTAMEKSSKAFEEMGELSKGNLEAMVESSKIAAKGVESMSQGAADFGRQSFEKTSATMKSFASIKSPAEFFQLQSELMSATMDSFASQAAKNSETMLKLASEIGQPISNRVSIVTEKMKSLAA